MRSVRFILAGVLVALAGEAGAQGTITWFSGYPSTSGTGAILVKGVAVPDPGWSPPAKVTVRVWQDGGAVTETTVDLSSGTWGEKLIEGLPSGVTVNVAVEAVMTNVCTSQTETIITEFKIIKTN